MFFLTIMSSRLFSLRQFNESISRTEVVAAVAVVSPRRWLKRDFWSPGLLRVRQGSGWA